MIVHGGGEQVVDKVSNQSSYGDRKEMVAYLRDREREKEKKEI